MLRGSTTPSTPTVRERAEILARSLTVAVLGVAFLLAACSTPPPPAPVVSATAPTAPPPATVASTAPVASAPASATASADASAPPTPPMAVRWTFRLPSFAGQPWTTQRLSLAESGDATWEAERGEGDGDIDEELSPPKDAATKVERCRAHVGPGLHRKLVEAARRAMASGCTQGAAADRLGRRVDVAITTVAVTWEGETKTCTLGRSGGSYVAFEQVRTEAVAAICEKR